jgi:hypothetical protein
VIIVTITINILATIRVIVTNLTAFVIVTIYAFRIIVTNLVRVGFEFVSTRMVTFLSLLLSNLFVV